MANINIKNNITKRNNEKENEEFDGEENGIQVTLFHIAEKYINDKYQIQYNDVSLAYEVRKRDADEFIELDEDELFIELQKVGIKLSMAHLLSLIKTIGKNNRYNPILKYFERVSKLQNNGELEFKELFECFKIKGTEVEQIFYRKQIIKWFCRCVKNSLNKTYFNKQCLTFVAQQNSGKTSFLRWIVPQELKKYYTENITNDKDSRIMLAKSFIINLDELATLGKWEVSHLKSTFTKALINERLPYDKKNTAIYRLANFCGSIDRTDFLTDESGSVRWLIVEVQGFFDYKKYKKINLDKIWSAAYSIAKAKGDKIEISREEVSDIQKLNKNYYVQTPEQELVSKFYLIPDQKNIDRASFVTSTEISNFIQARTTLKVHAIPIGKALRLMDVQRVKRGGIYGFLLIQKEIT